MKYTAEIQPVSTDPVKLENLYQTARQAHEEAEFRLDLQAEAAQNPDNTLLSAWLIRFENMPVPKARRAIDWGLAVALGLVTGLSLWAVSDPTLLFNAQVPYFLILWAPITTLPVLAFLVIASKRNFIYTVAAGIILAAACGYILLISPGLNKTSFNDYLILMLIQLPLLCWIAIGVSTLKFGSPAADRFAFLIKSIETMITAGIYLVFGMAFGFITLGMFAALDITPSEEVLRLLAAGGFGLIPILAVASMYDPHVNPQAQDFSLGLSKFVFTIMRLLLPLTLLVLLIYIFVIPFNFMAPFQSRDLLIIYNVMQFAIVGLLIGAAPIKLDDLSQKFQVWLRRGILAVVILASLISLYALSAVVYRTVLGGLTLNRLTIIGWNVINIGILLALAVSQLRKGLAEWNIHMQNIFSRATTAYLVWTVLLILVLPLIFR
jgi:hypothetical protein